MVENYQNCTRLADGTECAAMVKADAYGMGIEQVAAALFHQAGCRKFFVANLVEAIKLRQFVPEAIIYVLNGVLPGHMDYFIRHNIRPVLNDLAQIRLWASCDDKNRPPCVIHFDTGINRLGLGVRDTELFINNRALQDKVDISLIMSHLACSDDAANPMNARQLSDFKAVTKEFSHIPASLANSGGILLGPEYHFDLVRPGLLIFGGNPARGAMPDNIRMPFQILGKILQIHRLDPGQTVGYGATWAADKPCLVATLNIGYADGYPQMFNNCGQVYFRGKILPVIGRVSMDMIAVDITDINPEQIGPGCDIELLGQNITLEMASEVSSLSQYEILTAVRDRYQRIYELIN
ncbi:Alanine racemase [hydrothermal vent metagenome]|uniref:Alanine racemase n=1 Tax=hydrothermal vent metagenome TaxID=652676 RepID=A0A3B0S0G1_9ZZZZ